MGRIPVEAVIQAYFALGYKPVRGTFFAVKGRDGDRGCCGIGIIAASQNLSIDAVFDKYELPNSYRPGYIHGFDGLHLLLGNPDYIAGYYDGKAAWDAVNK